jgi:hypothetical protein
MVAEVIMVEAVVVALQHLAEMLEDLVVEELEVLENNGPQEQEIIMVVVEVVVQIQLLILAQTQQLHLEDLVEEDQEATKMLLQLQDHQTLVEVEVAVVKMAPYLEVLEDQA